MSAKMTELENCNLMSVTCFCLFFVINQSKIGYLRIIYKVNIIQIMK